MLFSEVSRAYEGYLRHKRNLTAKSLKTYHFWLQAFSNWTDAAKGEGDFTLRFVTTVLRRYQYHLSQTKKNRPRTIHDAIGPLRSLGDWGLSLGILKENPARARTLPEKDAAGTAWATESRRQEVS